MIKPDIIVSWPRNCDYPLWRQMIHDNRHLFNVVVIVFTETNSGDDYRAFVREAMQKDWVLFADSPIVRGEDWRQVAVSHGMIQSYNAEWVWFTEQDFFPGDGFWDLVNDYASTGAKVIGVKQGDRLHPCSLFLHRSIINKIDLNVSANPPEYDHFGFIQKQLEDAKIEMVTIDQNRWQHLNGLSHNMRLTIEGGEPNYMPDDFNEYLKKCMAVTVPLDVRFTKWVREYFGRVGIGL